MTIFRQQRTSNRQTTSNFNLIDNEEVAEEEDILKIGEQSLQSEETKTSKESIHHTEEQLELLYNENQKKSTTSPLSPYTIRRNQTAPIEWIGARNCKIRSLMFLERNIFTYNLC